MGTRKVDSEDLYRLIMSIVSFADSLFYYAGGYIKRNGTSEYEIWLAKRDFYSMIENIYKIYPKKYSHCAPFSLIECDLRKGMPDFKIDKIEVNN